MVEAKPVVLTKPTRGREMMSKKGTLDSISAEVGSEKKKVETYYEGFVDGKLYLVPDSNLEAMKDMINFKMRQKTSIRYKHQTSYDIQYYDQFTEKLNELLEKVDELQESGDFRRSSKSTQKSEQSKDRQSSNQSEDKIESIDTIGSKDITESKDTMGSKDTTGSIDKLDNKEKSQSESSVERVEETLDTEQVKSEVLEELEMNGKEDTTSSENLQLEDDKSLPKSEIAEDSGKDEQQPNDELPSVEEELKNHIFDENNDDLSDELRIRFLISGHFKDSEKPIYLLQEYDSQKDIFQDQKVDFLSSQKNSKFNVFISGKLYDENILVESEGKPSFLDTKPTKISVDEGKSKLFQGSFEHVFEKENYALSLQGKFVQNSNHKITPCLTFCVEEKSLPKTETDNE